MISHRHAARVLLALLSLIASACASVRPAIRPGGPLAMHFAPPAEMAQVYRAIEVREQTLHYPKGPPVTVRVTVTNTQLEKYAAQPNGDYLVSTTQLEESVTRDNVPQARPFSTLGLTLIHRIDSTGHFLGIENAKEVLDAVHNRLTTQEARQLYDPQLSPDYLTRPTEAAWHQRFDDVCTHPLAPGDITYAFDEQGLDDIGPIRTVIRQTVLGKTVIGSRSAEEIYLEFGGRDTDFAQSPGALDALLGFPDGINMLAVNVHGIGRRYVDTGTCQKFSEEAALVGEGRLNRTAAGQATMITLPLKVNYEIHRQIVRINLRDAERMGIPTQYVVTPYATAPVVEQQAPAAPVAPDTTPPRLIQIRPEPPAGGDASPQQ